MPSDHTLHLQTYLHRAREALVWKLDGLSEYDIRRPLVASGTNLLGLVKHMAGVEAEYFGVVFDRPFPEPMLWADRADEPNVDMWATAAESRSSLVGLYGRVIAHADRTIEVLDLETVGHVPWWPEERRNPTLHRVLVHVTAEIHHHAGHADILRELIDGSTGLAPALPNLQELDPPTLREHYARVEQAARAAPAQQ